MALTVILDAYNFIHTAGIVDPFGPGGLEEAREELVDLLAAYKKKRAHRITAVFDAAGANLHESRKFTQKGIQLVFSPPGILADAVIRRMARNMREQALVVSSDREVAQACLAAGAGAISSPEFAQKILDALHGGQDEDPDSDPRPKGTAKKGPARRSPRKARRSLKKADKL
ncbi:MAG: NYN domain-containing protein [Proteobacteria bacterium]|nr:NYN domain-containing protein [Pseudomonadota bacterium]